MVKRHRNKNIQISSSSLVCFLVKWWRKRGSRWSNFNCSCPGPFPGRRAWMAAERIDHPTPQPTLWKSYGPLLSKVGVLGGMNRLVTTNPLRMASVFSRSNNRLAPSVDSCSVNQIIVLMSRTLIGIVLKVIYWRSFREISFSVGK